MRTTLDVNGATTTKKLFSGSGASTIAVNAGAGTTLTVSISAIDTAGKITVTTGTTPTAAADIATVTFNAAYTAAPYVNLTPGGPNAAALGRATGVYVTPATATFKVTAGATALDASTTYIWYYSVIG